MELTHIATREGRLSSFLRQELGLSTGLMNRLKWADRLYVNGVPRHADFPVAVGDIIVADLIEDVPQYPAEDGPLTVLFEDEHILCVDKPSGMLIHPSRSAFTGTLANIVLGYYQKTGQNSAFHPVTRLDRDTYGVVLLAKNAHIHRLLSDLNAEGKLTKIYQALVYGCPEPREGEISAPIARMPLPSLLRKIDPEGKPSVTQYRVLEEWEGYSRLWLRPVTGRTHQLRLHCAHIGHPILGDPQYATAESALLSAKMGKVTQCLCAEVLRFPHPVTGEILEITTCISL